MQYRPPVSFLKVIATSLAGLVFASISFTGASSLADGNDAMATSPALREDCNFPAIAIIGASEREFRLICSGVLRSFDIFWKCRLKTPDRLRIQVTESPLLLQKIPLFGQYDSRSGVIRLVNLERAAKMMSETDELRSLQVEPFYESIVAHEAAHRIFRILVKDREHTYAAHEYVAYAAQITAMPKAVRRQFLQAVHRPAPTDLSLFVDMVLLFGPARFGAMAYDHFSAPGNGCRILRGLVTGEIEFPVMEELD